MSTSANLYNQAVSAYEKKDRQEAERLCRLLLSCHPDHGEGWHLDGILSMQQGLNEEALVKLHRAIQLRPDMGSFQESTAWCCIRLRKWQEAADAAQKALELQPSLTEAHYAQGIALRRLGRTMAAKAALQKGIAVRPAHPHALSDMAADLIESKEYGSAAFFLRSALAVDGNHVSAMINYAILLQEENKLDESLAYFQRANALEPANTAGRINLASLLLRLDRPREALLHLQWLLENHPPSADILCKMGTTHHMLGLPEQAIAWYRKALQVDPEHGVTHWELALSLLTMGELVEGFREYEWRWDVPSLGTKKRNGRYWQGPPEQVNTLFLHGEQGLGDVIQFVRYVPMVRPYANRIVMVCPEAAVGLFQSVAGVDRVVFNVPNCGETVDAYFPIMSLPHVFGTRLETIPAPAPYLSVPDDLTARWQQRLAGVNGFRVGIVWRGNPDHRNDARRSAPLALFAPLAALPGVRLISLQKQFGLDELATAPMPVHVLGPEWQDLLDTAAVIRNLDLVIAVDTSVAHLAGALGKPVWIALPRNVDWRWLREGTESAWYPTARLFRQGEEDTWPAVFAQITQALQQVVTGTAKLKDLSCNPPPLLEISPQHHRLAALYQHGERASKAHSWSDVITIYQEVVKLQPNNLLAWITLGRAYLDNKQLPQARDAFLAGLAVDDNHAVLHGLLGVALAQAGDKIQALHHFDHAIRLEPNVAEFHYNKGQALRSEKRWEEALPSLQKAASLNPTSPEVLLAIGQVYFNNKDWQGAIAALLAVLSWQPENYECHQTLGLIYKNLEIYHKAIFHADKARRIRPDNPAVYINLGVIYLAMRQDEEALRCYQKALFLDGSNPIAHMNLASVWMGMGKLDEAQPLLERAIALDPDYGEAHLHLAFILLSHGNWQRGFREYERRWQTKRMAVPDFQRPMWDGQPNNKLTLMVWSEQGIGDTIHFSRYLPLLRPLVGRLILRCPPSLVELFQGMNGVDQVVSNKQPLPAFDAHLSLLSAPHRLLGLVEGVEYGVPYLAAKVDRVEKWQPVVASLQGLRVGVVWQGNPDYPQDAVRSFHAACLTAISRLEGVSLLALQVGFGSEQLENLPVNCLIHRLPEPPADFADTAAIVTQLDLIISADTAVAHLALAMGKPVWIATYLSPDWRWMRGATPNPWYATVRLFTQKREGDWSSPFQEMVATLTKHLQKPREFRLVESTHTPPPSNLPRVTLLASQLHTAAALLAEGKLLQALPLVEEMVRQFPHYPPVLHLSGYLALQQRNYGQAQAVLQQVVNLSPRVDSYQSHLGCTLLAQEKWSQAEDHLRQAIALREDQADHYFNLGNALKGQGDHGQAIVTFDAALGLKPDYYAALVNKGSCLIALNQLKAARQTLEEAIRIRPQGATAHFGLARVLLAEGEWQRGFQEYEWRWRLPGFGQRNLAGQLWDGQPHPGESLLIHHEQGLGDFIQFSRFLPQVSPLFGRVVVQVPPVLQGLYQSSEIEWLPQEGEQSLPACDHYISLLSLPAVLEVDQQQLESLAPPPYLAAPHDHTFSQEKKAGEFWIGLCWQGKASHVNDGNRSLPLNTLAPLGEIPGVRLFSLQQGFGSEQVTSWPSSTPLEQPVAQWQDFAQLADFITRLDLVISVDSAVAHLAGGLGKKVWTLLPWSPDWRWGLHSSITPWYPTMQLFRQEKANNWSSVVEAMVKTLLAFSKRRLFILQHGLVNYSTHYYLQSRAMVDYCRQNHIPYHLYTQQNCFPTIVAELQAKPVFTYGPDLFFHDGKNVSLADSDQRMADLFTQGCQQISRDGIAQQDILLLPYVSSYELLAISQWLEQRTQQDIPYLVLNFHRPDFGWQFLPDGTITGNVDLYRLPAQTIHRLTHGRVRFSATTDALAKMLTHILRLPCHPSPIALPLPEPDTLPPSLQRYRVGVMGDFRKEQGSALSPAILLEFGRLRPGHKIYIQVARQQDLDQITPTLQECQSFSDLHVHVGKIAHSFIQQLEAMDILLLPYNPNYFRARSSGVFAMAVNQGKPMVVPAGTWMAEQIQQGLAVGEIFAPYTVEAACQALIRCHDHYDLLVAKAREKRQAWHERHDLKSWMDEIMNLDNMQTMPRKGQ
ncbi:MAG: tetratricopeptide repeat protein [Magnetococcales bacterium]|nr:tetratricopeptide repeat protein [Magnetococcales bacterium]